MSRLWRGFVTFPKPGGETRLDRAHRWTEHNEAYSKVFAIQRDSGWLYSIDGELATGATTAWVEWEAENQLVRTLGRPGKDHTYPRALWEPVHVPRDDYWIRCGIRTMDPYIWDGPFLYTHCRQDFDLGLHAMAPGSVVLFGSVTNMGEPWSVDSVLVLADRWTWSPTDVPVAVDSPLYQHVVAKGLKALDAVEFTGYTCATDTSRVNGMFSFVPAKPAPELPRVGWPKPTVALPAEFLNPRSIRSTFGLYRDREPDVLYDLWSSVAEQVIDQGCVLCTDVQSPRVQTL